MDVCPKENCASIEYVEGTLSPGALLCVIRTIDGELDFPSTRLVPIRRNMSDNFTIPVTVSGNYSVVAFDLENNNLSVPRIPISIAANDETIFLLNSKSAIICQCCTYTFLCAVPYPPKKLYSQIIGIKTACE